MPHSAAAFWGAGRRVTLFPSDVTLIRRHVTHFGPRVTPRVTQRLDNPRIASTYFETEDDRDDEVLP